MSLQVWLPLTGDFHNQGLADITVTNNGATIDNNGKIGKCYSFDGSDDFIKIEGTKLTKIFTGGSQQFSVCMWIYNNETAANRAILFGNYTVSPSTSLAFFNIELMSSSNQIRYDWKANPDWNAGSNTVIPTGTWTHLCCSYDGAQEYVYLNGQLQANRSGILPSMGISSGVIYYLGRDARTGATAFNGKLNDVRIYDHALSAKEVAEIAKGLVLHYKLDNIINSNLLSGNPNLINAWVQDGITLTQETDGSLKCVVNNNSKRIYNNVSNVWTTVGNIYTVSFLAKAASNGIQIKASRSLADVAPTITLTTNWQYYNVQITITATSSGGTLSLQGINQNDTFWIKNIKLENGTIATPYLLPGVTETTIYDSSGYGNNGTIIGSLTTVTPSPRYGCATKFDGSSYIKKTDFIYNSNIWSVSLWYFKPNNPTSYECLFCLSKANGGDDNNKKIAACPNSGRIWYKGESGTASISQLKINEWTNLIMTCDGTTVTVYQNASQIGTFAASTALTDRTDLVIGARTNIEDAITAAVFYTGNISDFRVYATALTAAQVQELYKTSMLVSGNTTIPRDLV